MLSTINTAYASLRQQMVSCREKWLVTGAAGFIGSALVEALLLLDQSVVGLDNFTTGSRDNLEDVRRQVSDTQWTRFHVIEGDIADPAVCQRACVGIDRVLHQAALGSVPRSLKDPWTTHRSNVDGFLHVVLAAQASNVRRVVYASSSSVYGDSPELPKVEGRIGQPLSPYAVTKLMDEQYAQVFHRCYKMPIIGLRYFNVFGRRQDPNGPYAAVIPRWISTLVSGQPATINGDGLTSRDFCYIENVVQANLLAATTQAPDAMGQAFNIACGGQMTLRELYQIICAGLPGISPQLRQAEPHFVPFREGDIRHSCADISLARRLLGFEPTHSAPDGLRETLAWYASRFSNERVAASK